MISVNSPDTFSIVDVCAELWKAFIQVRLKALRNNYFNGHAIGWPAMSTLKRVGLFTTRIRKQITHAW